MGNGDTHFELAYCIENFEGLAHIHEIIRVIQIQERLAKVRGLRGTGEIVSYDEGAQRKGTYA